MAPLKRRLLALQRVEVSQGWSSGKEAFRSFYLRLGRVGCQRSNPAVYPNCGYRSRQWPTLCTSRPTQIVPWVDVLSKRAKIVPLDNYSNRCRISAWKGCIAAQTCWIADPDVEESTAVPAWGSAFGKFHSTVGLLAKPWDGSATVPLSWLSLPCNRWKEHAGAWSVCPSPDYSVMFVACSISFCEEKN